MAIVRGESAVVGRLIRDLREPLQTLTSLANLLDLRAASLDASLRVQTTGFRDAIHHVDWVLDEALFFTRPLRVRPGPVDLAALTEKCVGGLTAQVQVPLRFENPSGAACLLYGDGALLQRFLTSALHMGDQLVRPDQAMTVRIALDELHGQVAGRLEIEGTAAHTLAADFAELEGSERNTPLARFGFAIANCRRILDAHCAAVEFADLRDSRLSFHAYFPVFTAEQWSRMCGA